MNKNELDARKAEHKAFGASLMNTPEFRQWHAEHEALAQAEGNTNSDFAAKIYGGYSDRDRFGAAPETKGLGKTVNPLYISKAVAKEMHAAARHGQNYIETKAAVSGISGLIPSQLQPGIVEAPFETRLMDHLPVITLTAPSLQYNKVTGVTGAPAIVAEGGNKPEVEPTLDKVVISPIKIAAWSSATREAISDYDGFLGWLTSDLMRRIVATENNELLVQTGTGSPAHVNGLINQAGLSHARPSDGTESSLDALELAISAMRAGSELCSPDLMVVHPTTWSIIRRRKDTLGRYLFANADATSQEVNTAWGVPLLITTDMTAGKALFINNGFGFVALREGLNTTVDSYSGSTNNIVKVIGEERLNLAVEHPNRLLVVTNLATDASDS